MAGPGRDQRGPMERLVRIAAVLKVAGDRGVGADKLVRVAGFDGKDRMDQLTKELRHLRNQGWQIGNVAEPGEPGHYRMVTVDNRFRVRLTAAQQRALQQAVLLADRRELVARLGLPADQTPPEVTPTLQPALLDEKPSTVLGAVRRRCLLRFRYGGRERVVHPESVRHQNMRWYLRAVEVGGDEAKLFVVARMSEVDRDAPGTAEPVEGERYLALHPMKWKVDPPVRVTVRAESAYRPDVERWLGTPADVRDDGDDVELTNEVTNRAALKVRLYELGPRVTLVGPEDVRRELLDELAALAEGVGR